MGRIKVKFRASRQNQSHIDHALVDSGADRTVLNLKTACRLGLDEAAATVDEIRGVGGERVRGYALNAVKIEAEGRKATLSKIFVPAAVLRDDGTLKKLSKVTEQLLGHDFLQASKSILDYEDDVLRGVAPGEATSLRMRFFRVADQAGARRTLQQLHTCPVRVKKRHVTKTR